MKRRLDIFTRRCWMDLFEEDYFMGRMRRLFGPSELDRLRAGSMIVGPRADVILQGRRNGKEITLRLLPNRLVPDLQQFLRGATIHSTVVRCARKTATQRRKNAPATARRVNAHG